MAATQDTEENAAQTQLRRRTGIGGAIRCGAGVSPVRGSAGETPAPQAAIGHLLCCGTKGRKLGTKAKANCRAEEASANKTGTGTSRHPVLARLSFFGSEPVPVLLEPVILIASMRPCHESVLAGFRHVVCRLDAVLGRADLAGMVRSMGLKPFRYTGFPFTVAVWGVGVAQYFDWWMLAGNTVIALGSSALLAWLCATVRCRVGITQCPQDRRPSEH